MKARIRRKLTKKLDNPLSSNRGKYSNGLPPSHPQVRRGVQQRRRYKRLVASRPGFPAHIQDRIRSSFARSGREVPPWEHRYYSSRKDRAYMRRASPVLRRLDRFGYVMPSYNYITPLTREMIRRGDLKLCPKLGWLRCTDPMYTEYPPGFEEE